MKIERYMSSRVNEEIPLEIQLFLWSLQDKIEREQKEIDYLQIYELSGGKGNTQVVKHLAEIPFHEEEYVFEASKVVIAKLYIIRDFYEQEKRVVETLIYAEDY